MQVVPDQIRELIGWDLDACEHRPVSSEDVQAAARQIVAQRVPYALVNPLIESGDPEIPFQLEAHADRPDLQAEMQGLDWSLAIVDIRLLLSFQRRLSFSANMTNGLSFALPGNKNLLEIAFGRAADAAYDLARTGNQLILRSGNPNLSVRLSSDLSSPFTIYGGSPFFEVAEYQGRWFLRDGYHRAYHLLQAGVHTLPAVVIRARTIEELGADQPWFFPEEVLFSATPPRVVDFLNDDLTVEYERPPLVKTLRISIEETIGFQIAAGGTS